KERPPAAHVSLSFLCSCFVLSSIPFPSSSTASVPCKRGESREKGRIFFRPPAQSHPAQPQPFSISHGRWIKMSSPSKRREMDLMKLMISDYKVEMVNDGMQEFFVDFHGPNESLYQGGVWRVRVELPDAYPYKSPSIGFINKIYHPNVDEMSGSVCLDVINQTWSPMFDLVNVFEVFLPQLLLYPNPSDPLNGEAAALMMRDRPAYEQKVKGAEFPFVHNIFVYRI
ncbi:unnamed protein product, partial [Musa acuminata var. zebrina]